MDEILDAEITVKAIGNNDCLNSCIFHKKKDTLKGSKNKNTTFNT